MTNIYTVHIADCGCVTEADAAHWAWKHCPSFKGWESMDVSDVSVMFDVVVEFRFADEHDALMFTLRWKDVHD
jgi:hypothetical protein